MKKKLNLSKNEIRQKFRIWIFHDKILKFFLSWKLDQNWSLNFWRKKSYIESDFWPNVYQKLSFKKPKKNRNSNFSFFLFFRWSRRIKLKIWLYLQHRKSHSIKKKIFPLPSLKTVTFVFLFSSPQTKNSGGFLKMFDKIYEELLTMVDNRWGSKFCCCHWYFIL